LGKAYTYLRINVVNHTRGMADLCDAKTDIKKLRRDALFIKLAKAFDEYVDDIVLVVNVNSAGSFQLQKLRAALRGNGILIMGKNTLIRKVLRERSYSSTAYQELFPFLTGTIGLLFTRRDVPSVQKMIKQYTYSTVSAKVDTIASEDIVISPGPTGLDPGRTCYFASLSVATKITRGEIEILNRVTICSKGEKISNIVACFLEALHVKPFARVAVIEAVYDRGYVFPYSQYILPELRERDVMKMFLNSVFRFAAISAALGIVNEVAMPYYFARAIRTVCAVSFAAGYNLTIEAKRPDVTSIARQFESVRVSERLTFIGGQPPVAIHH